MINGIIPIALDASNGTHLPILGFPLGHLTEIDNYYRTSSPHDNLWVYNLSYLGAPSKGLSMPGPRQQRPALNFMFVYALLNLYMR